MLEKASSLKLSPKIVALNPATARNLRHAIAKCISIPTKQTLKLLLLIPRAQKKRSKKESRTEVTL